MTTQMRRMASGGGGRGRRRDPRPLRARRRRRVPHGPCAPDRVSATHGRLITEMSRFFRFKKSTAHFTEREGEGSSHRLSSPVGGPRPPLSAGGGEPRRPLRPASSSPREPPRRSSPRGGAGGERRLRSSGDGRRPPPARSGGERRPRSSARGGGDRRRSSRGGELLRAPGELVSNKLVHCRADRCAQATWRHNHNLHTKFNCICNYGTSTATH
jgi:hypothetical protein